jgi:glucan biosynthesis protein C
MQTHERHHDFDNLRAVAMLAGVLFHAALAYSPLAHPVFPTADRQNAAIVDQVIWLLHLVRMPLFFLLAGYFTALQVERHGFGGMVRQRALRIGVPLLLFAPLVHASLSWLTLHAAATALEPSPLLAWLRGMQESGPLPAHPPGTSHLWFLYYIMLFVLLCWVTRSLGIQRVGARIAALPTAWIIGGLPLLLTPALASVPAPHPAPESVLPQFWALAFYGAFFALGHLMRTHPALIERCTRPSVALVACSLPLYALFLTLVTNQTPEQAFAGAAWPIALLEAIISVWMTLACLGLGRRLLHRSHPMLAYLNDASYWTYVVHLPILFAIQYRLLDVDMHWTAKLALSVTLTLAACLLSHQMLVRHTPLAYLFGSATRSASRRHNYKNDSAPPSRPHRPAEPPRGR